MSRRLLVLRAALLLTVSAGSLGWVRRYGPAPWPVPAARQSLADEAARGAGLEEQLHDIHLRHAAGSRVIDRLAAGEITLAAAAAELEALHGHAPDYLAGLRTHFPGTDDRERFARSAALRVRTRYPDRVTSVEAEVAALYPPAD